MRRWRGITKRSKIYDDRDHDDYDFDGVYGDEETAKRRKKIT